MKKKAIILTIITIIAIGIITLGVCWHNKNVKENSNLISCGNHIDEDQNMLCDNCGVDLSKSGILVKKSLTQNINEKQKVEIEGNMPAQSELTIKEVDENKSQEIAQKIYKDSKVIASYEIGINNKNQKYQPEKQGEKVIVKISGLELEEDKTYVILHMEDNNKKYEKINIKKIGKDTVEFKARSFSTYILVEINEYFVTFEGNGNFKVKTNAGVEVESGEQLLISDFSNFTVEPEDGYVVYGEIELVEKGGIITILDKKVSNLTTTYTIPTIEGNSRVKIRTTFAPKITEQPKITKAVPGEPVSFTVKSQYTQRYQWQYKEPGIDIWKNIEEVGIGIVESDEEQSKLIITNVTKANTAFEYRCLLINNGCNTEETAVKTNPVMAIYTTTSELDVKYTGEVLEDITGKILISGDLEYGATLVIDTSEIKPTDCNLTYKWYSNSIASTENGTQIKTGTNTYQITKAEIGKYIYVEVIATKDGYNERTIKAITYDAVGKMIIQKPKVSGEYIYTGTEQTVQLKNYNTTTMTASNITRTNSGKQVVTVSLKDSSIYSWEDQTTEDVKLEWEIKKLDRTLTIEELGELKPGNTKTVTYRYDGENSEVYVKNDNELVASVTNTTTTNGGTLTIIAKDVGIAHITITVKETTNYGDVNTNIRCKVANDIVVDSIPPEGTIEIKNAIIENGKKMISGNSVIVGVTATDNISEANGIKVYVSINEAPDTKKIPEDEWEQYKEGYTKTIKLPTDTLVSKVYVSIKDGQGNTNTVFTGTTASYNVVYNANGGTNAPATQTVYYGMPFEITKNKPTYEGKYFMGWSTTKTANTPSYYQGTTVPANVFVGTQSDITLYAVWTDNIERLPYLVSKVKVGDYVNYPVNYTDVTGTTMTGWRVIYVDEDTETIRLVSAGIPMTYNHYKDNSLSVTNLTKDFTEIAVTGTANTYAESGFASDILKTFSNKYTAKNGNEPNVRAMNANDISEVIGTQADNGTNVSDAKWNRLFAVGGNKSYWLATAYSLNTQNMLMVRTIDGKISNGASGAYGVRPVVTLKANVRTTGLDNQNVWKIEMPAEQELTITFDPNGGATWATDKTVVYGDAYGTLPVPTRADHEFIGWYTAKEGGEEINEDTTVTVMHNQTVYAQWEKLIPILYNVVEVGDYVNYPVYYNDVNGTDETRWVVISKNPDDLTVNLTTAGVPLTYYYNYSYTQNYMNTIINNLTNNFLNIPIGTSESQIQTNGFEEALLEVFDDQFVVRKSDGTPQVRAMNLDDVKNLYATATTGTDLSTNKILAVNQNYWIASAADSYYLYYVGSDNKIANDYTGVYGIRPIVTMRADVKIIEDTSGDGEYNIAAKYNKVKVTFDTDGGTTTQKSKIVITGEKYGALPIPEKKNREFVGWYTAKAGGKQITPETQVKVKQAQTLYAIYNEEMPSLSDNIQVGDYINYPVEYENVKIGTETSTLTGWRVLSKDVDLDGNESKGTINIISAGIPLEYYHATYAGRSKTNITTAFFDTPVGDEEYQYTKTGFISGDIPMYGYGENEKLEDLFTNEYTVIKNGLPRVRSITSSDILKATNRSSMATGTQMGLGNSQYNNLFANGATYWTELASQGLNGAYLWYVNGNGNVSSNGTQSSYGIRVVVSLKSDLATPGKDANGAWIIAVRAPVKSIITFDANGGTVSVGDKTVTEYEKYGTLPIPTKEGDEFIGWYTEINNGIKITEETIVTTKEDQILYALWRSDAVKLSEKVNVGDYVNYPVEYTNVEIDADKVESSLTGWRVLSKDVDLDGNTSIGTVNLISAGTPLEYYHGTNASQTQTNLTTGFFETGFGTGTYKFTKNGFASNNLTTEFTNQYTETDANGKPKARSITTSDIFRVTGKKQMQTSYQMELHNESKYGTLFKNDTGYWTELPYSTTNLWYLGCDASVANDKNSVAYGVRPVIQLKNTITTVGKNEDGAWNLEL